MPGTYYDPVDEYVRGLRWYDRGKYDYALKSWRPLAEAGDCDAQFMYGLLYFQGAGITQNFSEALIWWQKAANQGQPKAQFALGDIYYQGMDVAFPCYKCEVEIDFIEAYKWYKLAERAAVYEGEKEYLKKIIPKIRSKMTQEKIKKADKLIEEWKPLPAACKPRCLW